MEKKEENQVEESYRDQDRYQHRKGCVRIRFCTTDGKPVCKRNVEIRQTAHSFLFGCGAFETLYVTNSEIEESKRAFYEERMESG